jgi:hypothetical protein
MLVKGLNGTPLETSFLSQTQFSAVSILLSTIFKAALTRLVNNQANQSEHPGLD